MRLSASHDYCDSENITTKSEYTKIITFKYVSANNVRIAFRKLINNDYYLINNIMSFYRRRRDRWLLYK